MIPLSILDVFPVSTGTAPTQAIHASAQLVRRADELGYTRYWVAEHHNIPSIASSAPEVLIGHFAGLTRRIRIGAGGIMVPNHAPLHVLEVFRTLEALYPGRIDLGIGRAPGTDRVTSAALRRSVASAAWVNESLRELVAFASGTFPPDHPYRAIQVMPSDAPTPPLWMLGSTSAGAGLAAAFGLGFAFAGHFNMAEADEAVAHYRASFGPGGGAFGGSPRLIMAVSVVCGDSDDHAEELALPMRVAYARLAAGRPAPIPSLEEARVYRFSDADLVAIERFAEGAIVGGPATVRVGLERLAARTSADELMISTVVPTPVDRLASYERVASAWGLAPSFANG